MLDEAGFETLRAERAGFPFFNAYRLTVRLRGQRLVEDVARGAGSPPARAVMKVFGALFRLNLPRSPWGWQVVAIARFRGSTS